MRVPFILARETVDVSRSRVSCGTDRYESVFSEHGVGFPRVVEMERVAFSMRLVGTVGDVTTRGC